MPPGGSLRPFAAVLVVGIVLGAAPLAAQAPFTLTGTGGATIPLGSFQGGAGQGGDTRGDVAFGLQFTVMSSRWRSLYGGFSQVRFGCDDGGCPAAGNLVSTSWDLGARFHLARGAVSPWIQAGAIFLRVEREGVGIPGPAPEPDRPAVSDLAVGGEVGLGIDLSLSETFAVRPAARYSLADTRFGGELLRMRYLVVDLGLMLGF